MAEPKAAYRRQQPRPRERYQDDVREAEPSPDRPPPAEEERERTSDDVGEEEEHGLPPAPRERIEE